MENTIIFTSMLLGNWLFLTFCLMILVIMMASWIFSLRSNLPPCLPRLPLLGSLPFIPAMERCRALKVLRQRYGDIFTVYMGSNPVIVLNGYHYVKKAFVTNGTLFTGRPEVNILFCDILQGGGVVSKSGKKWIIHRAFFVQTVRMFGLGRNGVTDTIKDEIKYLMKDISKYGEESFDPQDIINKAILNIMLTMVTGKRYNDEDGSLKNLICKINTLIGQCGQLDPCQVSPFLKHLPRDPFKYQHTMNEVKEVRKMMERIIKSHKEDLDDNNIRDITDRYLIHMMKDKKAEENGFNEEELVGAMTEYVAAGSSSVAATLTWACAALARDDVIQSGLQKELNAATANVGRLPVYSERVQATPYLCAFIDEVHRIGDVTPIADPHVCAKDLQLDGYFIPGGTTVLANLNSVHTDSTIWENPDGFYPRHFLDNDNQYKPRQELAAFGLGLRKCAGQLFAETEVYEFMISLLANYQILPPGDGIKPSMEYISSMRKNHKSFEVRFVKKHFSKTCGGS